MYGMMTIALFWKRTKTESYPSFAVAPVILSFRLAPISGS